MLRIVRNFQTVFHHNYNWPSFQECVRISIVLRPLPAFGVLRAWIITRPNRWVVVTQICFNLHFANDIWCGVSFHMLLCQLHIFFCWKVLVWAAIKITIDWVAYEKQKSISHSSGEWKCEIMENWVHSVKGEFNQKKVGKTQNSIFLVYWLTWLFLLNVKLKNERQYDM